MEGKLGLDAYMYLDSWATFSSSYIQLLPGVKNSGGSGSLPSLWTSECGKLTPHRLIES